jgi:hypothetical protein
MERRVENEWSREHLRAAELPQTLYLALWSR